MKKYRYILFLMGILIISVFANQFIIDTNWYQFFPKYKKEITEILLVCIVFFIGHFSFGDDNKKWKIHIWKFIYIPSIFFFIAAAIADFFIGYSTIGRFRFFSIKEFLYGPVPYLLLYVLGNLNLKKSKKI